MTDKPVYLTAEGKKKLEEELDYLVNVRRREVAAEIQSAKEEGDISENSAYDEAKMTQGFVEGRIQTIEAQLLNAVIIKNGHSDKVSVGSKVTVSEDGMEETYYIVGSAEADPLNGKISNESPIGQALMGQRAGVTVSYYAPAGEIKLRILGIE